MKPDLFDHYDDSQQPPPKPDWLMIGLLVVTLGSLVWWLIP